MKPVSLLLNTVLLNSLLLSPSVFAHDGLKYDEPYARATAPNAVNSAIFMTIENHMANERSLVAAHTDAAEKVELHTVEKVGDMMKMRQVERITIPAHGEVQLKPGSDHIMLLNIKQPLIEGQNITVTLNYNNGETETMSVPVKKVMVGMTHHSTAHSEH